MSADEINKPLPENLHPEVIAPPPDFNPHGKQSRRKFFQMTQVPRDLLNFQQSKLKGVLSRSMTIGFTFLEE